MHDIALLSGAYAILRLFRAGRTRNLLMCLVFDPLEVNFLLSPKAH
jgi:hypothetical protein